MKTRSLVVTLTVTLLVVLLAGAYVAVGNRPNLGLDLQGGISAVYTAEPQGNAPVSGDVLDQTLEVIRARVDSLGVAEPDITRAGNDIIVQLPGISDAQRVQQIIGTTAQLEFRPVEAVIPPGDPAYDKGPDCTAPVDERRKLAADASGVLCGKAPEGGAAGTPSGTSGGTSAGTSGGTGGGTGGGTTGAAAADGVPKYRVGPVALTGERIADAAPTVGRGGFEVSLQLDGEGAREWASITSDLACQRDQGQPGMLAIVLDGVVESAPAMNPEVACGTGIEGGKAAITSAGGDRNQQRAEATDLALVLRTGALPVSLHPSTFDIVSPTLGSASLQGGLLAGGIGLALVAVWLLAFYRLLGVVALGQLAVFGVVTLGLISLLAHVGFALTLAGIAGLIVSIGITADSSIIFFERIRDEVNGGRTVRTGVRSAFTSAFRTNLAGNTVTLAAAMILYLLAVGPVRGFALMLGLASVLDIVLLYTFTRPIVFLLADHRHLTRRTIRVTSAEPTGRRGAAGTAGAAGAAGAAGES